MKSIYLNVSVFFLLFLFACEQPQHPLSIIDQKEIQKEVQARFDQMVTAINKLDARTWSEFYRKDGFISAFVGTDYYGTRKEFVDAITNYFSMRDSQKIEPISVQVKALSLDLALLTSEEKAEMAYKNGKTEVVKHVFTLLWKKEQDGWKIIHAHESWVDIK